MDAYIFAGVREQMKSLVLLARSYIFKICFSVFKRSSCEFVRVENAYPKLRHTSNAECYI